MTKREMMNSERRALTIIARHLNRSPNDLLPEDTLADLGVESLVFIVILLEIQKEFGREILNPENVAGIRTIRDVLDLLGNPQAPCSQ